MSGQIDYQHQLVPTNERFLNLEHEEFLNEFEGTYNEMAEAVNKRDYGFYSTDFVLCGQTRFNRTDKQNLKNVIRKVVDFGTLPNAALKQVAHGITIDANIEFIRIYGTANNPGVAGFPIPNDWITYDTTNINITTPDNRTAYTICTVTLEYIGG